MNKLPPNGSPSRFEKVASDESLEEISIESDGEEEIEERINSSATRAFSREDVSQQVKTSIRTSSAKVLAISSDDLQESKPLQTTPINQRTVDTRTFLNNISDLVRNVKTVVSLQYHGEMLNDKADGKGKMVAPEGTYVGAFKGGKIEGKGTFTYNDGEIHEGIFHNGALVHGKVTYPNGTATFMIEGIRKSSTGIDVAENPTPKKPTENPGR